MEPFRPGVFIINEQRNRKFCIFAPLFLHRIHQLMQPANHHAENPYLTLLNKKAFGLFFLYRGTQGQFQKPYVLLTTFILRDNACRRLGRMDGPTIKLLLIAFKVMLHPRYQTIQHLTEAINENVTVS